MTEAQNAAQTTPIQPDTPLKTVPFAAAGKVSLGLAVAVAAWSVIASGFFYLPLEGYPLGFLFDINQPIALLLAAAGLTFGIIGLTQRSSTRLAAAAGAAVSAYVLVTIVFGGLFGVLIHFAL
jgi:hypothetical protein